MIQPMATMLTISAGLPSVVNIFVIAALCKLINISVFWLEKMKAGLLDWLFEISMS